MRILLVDDDILDRKSVKRALRIEKNGIALDECTDAHEGIALVEKNTYDVILLDYLMPRVDGIEMVIELRNRPHLGNTAIIMLSTFNDEELALSCLQAGAQDFISKSELTSAKLKRALVQAQKRFELEKKLYDSYCQVRELAEKDSLTGLSNRYHFDEALKTSVQNNLRTQQTIALLLLDLDHFKNVNDTYGHETGDELLKKVVNIIQDNLRGNELFARLGGDEFAILLTGLKRENEATLVAIRIIAGLDNAIEVNGHLLQCGVSIGIAVHPMNASSAAELTKYADIAMYRAKKQGRNQLCYFEDSMQQQFSRAYRIEIELKEAVEKLDFKLHYQAVFTNKGQRLIGFEALIRWPNCSLKSAPDEFIPIAEETRVIGKIGKWVIETAIEQLAKFQKSYDRRLYMAVNLSPIQLGDEAILTYVSDSLKRYQIKPEDLVLEITETALLDENENNKRHIEALSKLGCKLALDDFGTGFSSFSHLVNYPIDIVKLDKSLLPHSDDFKRHLSIVEALVSMANIIGLKIVAEGVETEYQYALCQRLSINKLQGYYFSKPMLAKDIFNKWLSKPFEIL